MNGHILLCGVKQIVRLEQDFLFCFFISSQFVLFVSFIYFLVLFCFGFLIVTNDEASML